MLKKNSLTLSLHSQNDCDDYQVGKFGRCKNCGKQKRSHSGQGDGASDSDATVQSPHAGAFDSPSGPNRVRKTSRAAAMKANDTSKVTAISVMRTCEPTIQGYLGKLPSGIGAIKRDYQERYFVLSAHYLAYYAGKPAALEDDPKGVYDISSANCSMCNPSADGTQEPPAEFEVCFPYDNSVLKLRGRSAENSVLWVQHLSEANKLEASANQPERQPEPQQKKAKWNFPKMGSSKSSKCEVCKTSVYANDAQLKIDSTVLHKVNFDCEENSTACQVFLLILRSQACAKCCDCKCQLTLSNYTSGGEG